ncbi:MAG: SDR family oxidoreductase [Kiloniellales bacterium]
MAASGATHGTMLVAGATGVVGRGLIEHLQSLDGWAVMGLARRPPDSAGNVRYLSVDLLDPADCRAKLTDLGHVTHIVYCAYADRPSLAEQVAPNLAMLSHLVEAVEPAAKELRRIVLIEGTKYYGAHLGPFKTPAKEDDPRCLPPMFYFDQEDYLRARQPGRSWTWTALRPQTVCGFSLGSPMNLITTLGVYAAISKELGLPLRFPGKVGAYDALYQVCESVHLARAILWAATEPKCANEAFNITNGDFFRWRNLWPRLADLFAMPAGDVQTLALTAFMADKGPLWEKIVARHRLEAHPFDRLAAWPFADYVFGCDWDVMSNTTKARQYGFADVVDSEAMFLDLFQRFREERIIP